MKAIKIKGYEVHASDLKPNDYDITKNGREIAQLKEERGTYNAYIVDAGGSINYGEPPESKRPLKILPFLNTVISDIEDYYERSRYFI